MRKDFSKQGLKLYKYPTRIVITEARLFLRGHTFQQISELLNIPTSTISNHLIHHLLVLDPDLWLEVRDRLRKRAIDPERVEFELMMEKLLRGGKSNEDSH